jgi:hypothetical protein
MIKKISVMLKDRHFLSIATADNKGKPHSAPKFLFKIEDPYFYLVDYTIAGTVKNLRLNPWASMSFMDLENLEGYRLSGSVELIERGHVFKALLEQFNKKLIHLSADRVIEGLHTGKRLQHFELEIPDKVIFIKVKIEEVIRLGSHGELFSEMLRPPESKNGVKTPRR